jgi:hypothetical protein
LAGEDVTRFVTSPVETNELDEERKEEQQQEEEKEEEKEEEPGAVQLVSLTECESFVSSLLQQFQGRRVDNKLIHELRSTMLGRNQNDDEAGDVEEESQNEGGITWFDFRVYLAVFGSSSTLALLLIFAFAAAAFTVVGNIWLAKWTDDMQTAQAPANITSGLAGANVTHSRHTEPVCFLRTNVVEHVACGLVSSSILHMATTNNVSSSNVSSSNVSLTSAAGAIEDNEEQLQRQNRYLLVYALLGVAGGVSVAMQTILLTLCALRASRELHKSMLKRILDAPMAFFDRWVCGMNVQYEWTRLTQHPH